MIQKNKQKGFIMNPFVYGSTPDPSPGSAPTLHNIDSTQVSFSNTLFNLISPNGSVSDVESDSKTTLDPNGVSRQGNYNLSAIGAARFGIVYRDHLYRIKSRPDAGNLTVALNEATTNYEIIFTPAAGNPFPVATLIDNENIGIITYNNETFVASRFNIGIRFNEFAFTEVVNYVIQSIEMCHTGEDNTLSTESFSLEFTFFDKPDVNNVFTVFTQAYITINITPLVFDEFIDYDDVIIHNHAPALGSQWIKFYDIKNSYAYSDCEYKIFDNRLIRADTSGSVYDLQVINDIVTTSTDFECLLMFEINSQLSQYGTDWFSIGNVFRSEVQNDILNGIYVICTIYPSGYYVIQIQNYLGSSQYFSGTLESLFSDGIHSLKVKLIGSNLIVALDTIEVSHEFDINTENVPSLPGKQGFFLVDNNEPGVISIRSIKIYELNP